MNRIICAILLGSLVSCGGSGSDLGRSIIRADQARTPAVTIVDFDPFPNFGPSIFGPIADPGGGPPPNTILEINGWRDGDKVVFRILLNSIPNFVTDSYAVFLDGALFQDAPGRIVIATEGDPAATSKAVVGFFPAGPNNGFEIEQFSATQRMDDPLDEYLYLELPLSAFSFSEPTDDLSVFPIFGQIQRTGGQFIDTTPTINVDLVNP